jgi:hypothetical protein
MIPDELRRLGRAIKDTHDSEASAHAAIEDTHDSGVW